MGNIFQEKTTAGTENKTTRTEKTTGAGEKTAGTGTEKTTGTAWRDITATTAPTTAAYSTNWWMGSNPFFKLARLPKRTAR